MEEINTIKAKANRKKFWLIGNIFLIFNYDFLSHELEKLRELGWKAYRGNWHIAPDDPKK